MVQLSDDCFAHGGRLMRTDEALAMLAERLDRVTDTQKLPLYAAIGRILSEDHGATVSRAQKPTFTRPAPAEVFDEVVARSDAVVEALAD